MTEPQDLLAAELDRLASALADLDIHDWRRPSLCTGWQIRHVIAHLTMPVRYDPPQFQAELQADGYDFQAMSDRLALQDGDAEPSALLANLRSPLLAGFEQPGGGWLGSLTHVVVHGLDVTLPLGLGRIASEPAVRLVLDGLTATSDTTIFGVDLGNLVAVASGRTLPVDQPPTHEPAPPS